MDQMYFLPLMRAEQPEKTQSMGKAGILSILRDVVNFQWVQTNGLDSKANHGG